MKKINLIKLASLVIALTATSSLYAQGIKDVRINELLIDNASSVVNKMGERSTWIELTNIGYSTLDLGGCRVVKISPSGEETSHVIPKGLNTTSIAPQNYILMYFGASATSPLSATFGLEDAKEIRIYDASGKTIVDKVFIDTRDRSEDVSYDRPFVDRNSFKGRREDADIETRNNTLIKTDRLTPGFSNFPPPLETRSEAFRHTDPYGIGMAVIAMSVVILALLCLFGVFAQVGSIMQKIARKKENKANPNANAEVTTNKSNSEPAFNSETLAAIGLAIRMYNDELNESEARIITINRTAKAYSPWSSKIYGLTQLPERKK